LIYVKVQHSVPWGHMPPSSSGVTSSLALLVQQSKAIFKSI
jgi:hypothetical protein